MKDRLAPFLIFLVVIAVLIGFVAATANWEVEEDSPTVYMHQVSAPTWEAERYILAPASRYGGH